jgi:hypothetical protein
VPASFRFPPGRGASDKARSPPLDEVLLSAIDGRGSYLHRRGNLGIGHARRGGQENLGAFHATHRPCAAADDRLQLLPLALLQLDAVS